MLGYNTGTPVAHMAVEYNYIILDRSTQQPGAYRDRLIENF